MKKITYIVLGVVIGIAIAIAITVHAVKIFPSPNTNINEPVPTMPAPIPTGTWGEVIYENDTGEGDQFYKDQPLSEIELRFRSIEARLEKLENK
jgi:hypothetical protein